MAQLLIRNIEPELKQALERRAERNSCRLEAEVCEIIRIVLDEEDEDTATCSTP
jgi:plasmid stability protein